MLKGNRFLEILARILRCFKRARYEGPETRESQRSVIEK
jgi:hypothetical protein